MAIAMFAKTLENLQHLTWLIPKEQLYMKLQIWKAKNKILYYVFFIWPFHFVLFCL
jgi:hypothetical protein